MGGAGRACDHGLPDGTEGPTPPDVPRFQRMADRDRCHRFRLPGVGYGRIEMGSRGAHRPPIEPPADSRRFTNRALAELRAARWSPAGWGRFLARCGVLSWQQVRLHPRAALEVTALHLALLPMARRAPVTLATGWLLAITHLGLLGPEARSIGAANGLSLVRAQLPTGPAAPLLAMASDLADGSLARRAGATAFGGYADALADVTFWTRFAVRRAHPLLAGLAVAAWTAPALAITIAYFVHGRAIDYPRPVWVRRLSAGLQCLIAVTALARKGG